MAMRRETRTLIKAQPIGGRATAEKRKKKTRASTAATLLAHAEPVTGLDPDAHAVTKRRQFTAAFNLLAGQ